MGNSVGRTFRYKEEEFEDDLEFKSKHPSNMFIAHSIVVYNADKRQFMPANVRYARKNLHIICYSVDVTKLVIERGSACGYSLNVKKCVYLMAPTAKKLTIDELGSRLPALIALGAPAQNAKTHPDCQCGLPADVAANRGLSGALRS